MSPRLFCSATAGLIFVRDRGRARHVRYGFILPSIEIQFFPLSFQSPYLPLRRDKNTYLQNEVLFRRIPFTGRRCSPRNNEANAISGIVEVRIRFDESLACRSTTTLGLSFAGPTLFYPQTFPVVIVNDLRVVKSKCSAASRFPLAPRE
ncbi:hypothetical protein PUN28_007425 [Cardiocondyla obscurior]|uniref:Uncharacterized protein n=1 Tax=Cardiocondyla obscurior TaxID=286306 RepID=A0AAW2G5J2_9HYME